ncbi:transposase [Pararoseomonas indoligenes]|uniref:Transposase n=1 Tax=Roseomonas indoligenes TaxID=2820811 RepID=A0A940MXB7_9PROT|nr:transposase [Pararoseomonas indoligenes]MBP0493821.1 transposase [Pararoseomonas indoligenes]
MPHSRPWSPLTDAEWSALSPHLPLTGAGRPIPNPRARLDAIFQLVTTTLPWCHSGSTAAPADTLHRQFRRWARAGVWSRLLRLAARKRAPKPLRALLDWLCAAHRRTYRLLGIPVLTLARRLNLPRALPGPSWLLPDPSLAALVHRAVRHFLTTPLTRAAVPYLRNLRALLRTAAGRRRIPACLQPS